jgi:hypothetical protein
MKHDDGPRQGRPTPHRASFDTGYVTGYHAGYSAGWDSAEKALLSALMEEVRLLVHDVRLELRSGLDTPQAALFEVLTSLGERCDLANATDETA